MAEARNRSFVLYAIIAAAAIVVLIAFFALSPVRRPQPTINGAPPENATTNLTGGPVNGVGPSLGGNSSGDR